MVICRVCYKIMCCSSSSSRSYLYIFGYVERRNGGYCFLVLVIGELIVL